MRRKTLNSQLIGLLITVIILYSITAIVPRLISTYLTTYFYLIVLAACFVLVMVSRGRKSLSEYLVLVIPFILWKLLIYFIEKPSVIDWGYGVLLDFMPIVLGLYITKYLGFDSVKGFSVIIILSVLATMLTTYIGLQEYPDAARYLATVDNPNEAKYLQYNMMNIGGYGFVYITVLLYPIVIYAFKRKQLKLIWLILLAVFELMVIISSGYTTAFLLWMLSTVFIFFKRDFKLTSLIVVVAVALVVFFLLWDLISDGLKLLADNIDNRVISDRLRDLSGGQEGLKNSDDKRLDLFLTSLNTFFAHPIVGSLGGGAGGHSFILDNLAKYGLLGAAIFAFMYVVIFKKFFMPYKNTQGYGYVVWMFIQTLILSTVNTGMWLYVLCLYIPILLALINRGGAVRENTLDSQFSIKRFKSRIVW